MKHKFSLLLWILYALLMAYRFGGLQARTEYFNTAKAKGVASAFNDLHLIHMKTEIRDWRICTGILTLCLALSAYELWLLQRKRRTPPLSMD